MELAELHSALQRKMSFEDLLAVWRRHNPEEWREDVGIYVLLGDQLIRQGELLIGLDVVSSGLRVSPQHTRLRQLQALALAGSGATALAARILSDMAGEHAADTGETLGILGRTHKDLWRQTGESTHLQSASRVYRQAFELSESSRPIDIDGALYNGINAATTLFLLGEIEQARHIARDIRIYCQERLRSGPDYWAEATLAESALLLGEMDAAAEHYGRAAEGAKGNWRDLASMRRQAREILGRSLGEENRKRLDACFGIGPVVVFAGHMVDTAQRLKTYPERFPARYIDGVAAAIRDALQRIQPSGAFSSAACGSDILFLEALRQGSRDCSACVVLPFSAEEFVQTSVGIAGGDWEERFHRGVDWVRRTGRIEQVSEHPFVFESASYDYCNMILQGLAAIQADRLDTDLVCLAVWDGLPGAGPGGTSSIVRRCLDAGLKLHAIHPSGETLSVYSPPPAIQPVSGTRVVALLFADVEHYTHLTETQIPIFRDEFLTTVADVMARMGQPDLKNTWGDALYFVFEDVRRAASFAIELQDTINTRDWEAVGLPRSLRLRVALHAGPVYECVNPVTETRDYLGTHISRAARIEPKTASGQIYCSQQFVALARAAGVRDFAFEYVGRVELPKGAGVIPVYNVKRTDLPF